MNTHDSTNPLDLSSLPDLPRPSSSAYKRTSWSPSRSPARSPSRLTRGSYYDYGSVYKDLSPGTTLRVIKASLERDSNLHLSDEKLVKSIDTASVADKNFGLKCAESSRLVRAWVEELDEWPWDWDYGVSRSSSVAPHGTAFPIATPESEDGNVLSHLNFQNPILKDLPQFEGRLDEIRHDLRDLDMEEQKEFVREHIQDPSGLQAAPAHSKGKHADGLTALVTMTVLQTLPYYSRLLTLIAAWTARLSVYQQMPDLKRQIESVREALTVAWSIVTKDKTFLTTVGEEHASVIARSRLTQEFLDSLKSDMREAVSQLGKRLDGMLDVLRRNGDDLPHKWIDAVESLEQEFHHWALEAPKILVHQESQPGPNSRKNSSAAETDEIVDQGSTKTHRVSMANDMLQSLVANHRISDETIKAPDLEQESDRPTTVIYNPSQHQHLKESSTPEVEDWSNGSFFRRSSSPDVKSHATPDPDTSTLAQPSITVEEPQEVERNLTSPIDDFSQFDFGMRSSNRAEKHERGRSPFAQGRETLSHVAADDTANDEAQIGTAHSTAWDELDEHIATRTFVKSASPSPARSQEPSRPQPSQIPVKSGPRILESKTETPKVHPQSRSASAWDELDELIATRQSVKSSSPSPARQATSVRQTAPIVKDRPRTTVDTTNENLQAPPPADPNSASQPHTPWDELDELIATRQLVAPLPKDAPKPPRSGLPVYTYKPPKTAEPSVTTTQTDGVAEARPEPVTSVVASEETRSSAENDLPILPKDHTEPLSHLETVAEHATVDTHIDDSKIDELPVASDPQVRLEDPVSTQAPHMPEASDEQPTAEEYTEPITGPITEPNAQPDVKPDEIVANPAVVLETEDPVDLKAASTVDDSKTRDVESVQARDVPEPVVPAFESDPAEAASNETVHINTVPAVLDPELTENAPEEDSVVDSADIPLPSIEQHMESEAPVEDISAEDVLREVSEKDDDDDRPATAVTQIRDDLRLQTEDLMGSPLSATTSRPRTASTFDGDSALAALDSPLSDSPDYDAIQSALPDVDDEEDAQGKYEDVVKDLKVKKTRKSHLQTYTNKDLGLDDNGAPIRVKFTHSRHISDADKMLEQKIDSILPTIPASIEFKKEPPRSPGQAILEQFKKRSAIRKGLAAPELTLAPAFQQTTKTSRAGFASEIKLYHLTSADRADPIKLYVRLVGERAERVMVRVGGGWADLGEYLRDFALHHARATSAGDAAPRPTSRMTSLSPRSKTSGKPGTKPTTDRRNVSMPTSLPAPKNPSNRAASRLSARTTSRQGSRAASRASPRPDDEQAPTLGMSGPRSNTEAANEMSEEQQRWVDTMLERAKEFRPSESGAPILEDMGKVNNTRRVYKVSDLTGSGSNGSANR